MSINQSIHQSKRTQAYIHIYPRTLEQKALRDGDGALPGRVPSPQQHVQPVGGGRELCVSGVDESVLWFVLYGWACARDIYVSTVRPSSAAPGSTPALPATPLLSGTIRDPVHAPPPNSPPIASKRNWPVVFCVARARARVCVCVCVLCFGGGGLGLAVSSHFFTSQRKIRVAKGPSTYLYVYRKQTCVCVP